MKFNLTVDLLMTVTVILSCLVFIDQCSARLRPMSSSSASLAKVGNLAADHLSALQQTSRKITKSSVVGINWKNVLLLAGIKAGLVGAKIVKKKVAYKKLKGLKSINGFDPLVYPFSPYNPYNGGVHHQFDTKLNNKLPSNYAPYSSPYSNIVQSTSDWSKQPTPRSVDKYVEYAPVLWRKSSLCTELNHCADYLTSSSITYQLLGTSLPSLNFPILVPTTLTSSTTKLSAPVQSDHLPYVLTWVKSPSVSNNNNINNNNEITFAHSQSTNQMKELNNNLNNVNDIAIKQSQIMSHSMSQAAVSSQQHQQPSSIISSNFLDKTNFLNQEKEDEQHQFSTSNLTTTTHFKDTVQLKDELKDHIQFKDNSIQYPETPSDQLVENSNKISAWSA